MCKIKNNKALIKINSHRAREKLERLLGYLPQGYYSFWKTGEWIEVSLEELQQIKNTKIKGITQSKWFDTLRKYINWG